MARLEAFERGALPLHQLVGDLKGVQDSLPEPEPNWKSDFDKYRFALEEVNALRLDEGGAEDNEYSQFVAEAVRKLKALLDVAE